VQTKGKEKSRSSPVCLEKRRGTEGERKLKKKNLSSFLKRQQDSSAAKGERGKKKKEVPSAERY